MTNARVASLHGLPVGPVPPLDHARSATQNAPSSRAAFAMCRMSGRLPSVARRQRCASAPFPPSLRLRYTSSARRPQTEALSRRITLCDLQCFLASGLGFRPSRLGCCGNLRSGSGTHFAFGFGCLFNCNLLPIYLCPSCFLTGSNLCPAGCTHFAPFLRSSIGHRFCGRTKNPSKLIFE